MIELQVKGEAGPTIFYLASDFMSHFSIAKQANLYPHLCVVCIAVFPKSNTNIFWVSNVRPSLSFEISKTRNNYIHIALVLMSTIQLLSFF